MRIAVYSGSIPSTPFIERLIEGMAKKEVEVLVCGRMQDAQPYQKEGVVADGFRGRISEILLTIKFLLMFSILRFKDFQKLISVYRNSKTRKRFTKWFAEAAPTIWRRPDIFHIQWAKSTADWLFLKDFGIPLVLSLRGAHINYSPLADAGLAESYREMFPGIAGFHAVSGAIKDECTKYGLKEDDCRVVYSGLRLADFPFNPAQETNKSLKIISVGRPHWIKGYEIALDAMARLKQSGIDFHYQIIGGVNEEHLFQIHDLELTENVSYTGKLDIEDVKSRVSEADVLLVPSVLEGLPNVMLEAMALGTTVVATETGGVPEVIENGLNGFLVENRSSAAIAETIIEISTSDKESIARIRKNARLTIESNHTEEKMVDEMLELYRSI